MEERRSRSASKLEEAERLLIEEKGRVEEMVQELASLRVTASEAATLSEKYQVLSEAFSKLEAESQGCNTMDLDLDFCFILGDVSPQLNKLKTSE